MISAFLSTADEVQSTADEVQYTPDGAQRRVSLLTGYTGINPGWRSALPPGSLMRMRIPETAGERSGSGSGDLDEIICLDDIVDLHLVESFEYEAALKAFADFLGVVLEPLEGSEASFVDLLVASADRYCRHGKP